MTLLDPLLHSPQLPNYVRQLADIMEAERAARERFQDELREDQKAEFINGEVIVHSPARIEHISASDSLHRLVSTYVLKHSLGFVGHEKLLVSLSRNDYEPDISFFGPSKSSGFVKGQLAFPAPDLAVEILSPSTETQDRTTKFEDYATHGVDEYWIVDADDQTIEQYLLDGDHYTLAIKIKEGIIRSRAINGFEIPARAAFDAKIQLETLARMLNA